MALSRTFGVLKVTLNVEITLSNLTTDDIHADSVLPNFESKNTL